MVQNRIIFFATSVQPNPEEIDYWVDLSDNPYGGSIKYFNGTKWVRLAASGGTPDLSNYYTKTQVNKLLNDKANISDVDSKVDDEEVKDVIKDIQFNTSNPNGITMVMFKYDGSNDSISLPIASTGSAGIVTSKDFLDFVKQHQLQELHTEMIDTFADIRAKYQKKLIAGLNIEIDQETNVISASGDLAVQWDNITNKPDFKPVATSGDYNDLINKLKPGKDVSISEDNTISIAIDSDSYVLPAATTTTLGGIIVGDRLSIDDTGKLVATYTYTLPTASSSALGGVKIGSNITLANGGTISITKANVTSALGVDPTTTYVKKAGDTMTGALTNSSTISGSKLISTVATGTAPIQVSSTTLCTNLNADMVDGVDVKDIEHTLYMQSTTKNYLKIQVNHKYFPNSYKIVEYIDGYIYVYQLLINAYSPAYTDLQLISGKVHTGIKTFYDLTKWYIETTESGINIYIRQVENSNTKIYGVIHGDSQSSYVQFSVVDSLPSNVVSRNITFTVTSQNLEELDWYGVSWSETSSNPDCTRIGNMDMHRTLPIQSMMKGYALWNTESTLGKGTIRQLTDDWSGSIGSDIGMSINTGVKTAKDINIFIKIPEFWYTDEYDYSTNTHNLKISPNNKPGWNHHKEAYVGAYEGYNDTTYYRSTKDKLPTVNVTRSTLRPLARANSNIENDCRYNIYTYEEHRAICHLFLVEYATRNSQKAVNTALTVEGFRQGGLGSGCTTGAVTINGATTYSFIPTGSSDSLGNGSGEVTVTIQQTDSSGANTTTTTRKCNRYRGIENPFGHVWKHTDDVISVYNGTNKYWSKCYNPKYFANTKNSNYINLCGSGVITGYKTSVVSTPTCDFFAAACTNGSESTYWCDYNGDNTDASEHCLLIGGRSGDGGQAGLFTLDSNDGVSASYATIGSRLTYLPWAE